jgi:hypothetical protein
MIVTKVLSILIYFLARYCHLKLTTNSKRQKQNHKTTEIVGEVIGTGKPGIVRILLDTGASATIILKDAIRGLTGPVFKSTPTKWYTMGGQFVTKLQREIKFKLPEFSTSKIIHWVCHEDTNTLRRNAQYDMIIGADLLSELGVEINFNTQRIIWEGVEIPLPRKTQLISDLQNATLCEIGVLTKCNDSEWAAPTFIQPKKTGNVRVLTDFRVLNKYIKQKTIIPVTQDR